MIVSQMLGVCCIGSGRRASITTTASLPPLHLPPLLLLLLLSLCHQGEGLWCVQCEGGEVGGEACLTRPPEPRPCPQDMIVCMTVRTYSPAQADNRRLVSLVRTCGPTDMGWDCERGQTEEGLSAEVCHDTCSWHGCNHSPSLSPATSLLLLPLLWAASALLPLLGAPPV